MNRCPSCLEVDLIPAINNPNSAAQYCPQCAIIWKMMDGQLRAYHTFEEAENEEASTGHLLAEDKDRNSPVLEFWGYVNAIFGYNPHSRKIMPLRNYDE